MKLKSKYILAGLSMLLLITGCELNNTTDKYDTTGLSHTSCKRNAYANDENTTVTISYDLYSDSKGYLKVLKSKEVIEGSNSELLDQFEQAYKNIYKAYKDIDYYENKVTRDTNKVISSTKINYGKVDIDKVFELEGKDNNVKVTNGKIKLTDWESFAEKYGTTCD